MKKLVDIIILGAKPVKGMKSLGALSNVEIKNNKTILDLQISNLHKKFNIQNIYYVSGHQHAKINDEKIKIVYNENYCTKNNGESLKIAIDKVSANNVIIIFNKILFTHKIFNRFDYDNSYIFINDNDLNTYAVGCIANESTIDNLFYNLPNKVAGIYCLSKNELGIVKEIMKNHNNIQNLFMFEIINLAIENGGTFKPKHVNSQKDILCIDSIETLKKIKRFYSKNFIH